MNGSLKGVDGFRKDLLQNPFINGRIYTHQKTWNWFKKVARGKNKKRENNGFTHNQKEKQIKII